MAFIALYGGAFDPPHLGHDLIVRYLLATRLVERVKIIPSSDHPFEKKMASEKDRMIMLSLMFQDLAQVSLCSDDGKTKTFDFVNQIQKEYPLDSFFFVVGEDNAWDIQKWYRGEELMKSIPFIVFPRHGIKQNFDAWYAKYPHFYLKNFPQLFYSSSYIRCHPEEFNTKLSPSIVNYIRKYNLYGIS